MIMLSNDKRISSLTTITSCCPTASLADVTSPPQSVLDPRYLRQLARVFFLLRLRQWLASFSMMATPPVVGDVASCVSAITFLTYYSHHPSTPSNNDNNKSGQTIHHRHQASLPYRIAMTAFVCSCCGGVASSSFGCRVVV